MHGFEINTDTQELLDAMRDTLQFLKAIRLEGRASRSSRINLNLGEKQSRDLVRRQHMKTLKKCVTP